MRKRHLQSIHGNRGAALIITLGLLAVLTLLAVAFAVAMRVESMAARNHVNLVKAKQLTQTALSKAMDDINATCAAKVYPDWNSVPGYPAECLHADALGSRGDTSLDPCEFLEGEATNAFAKVLWPAANSVNCYWRNIVVTNDTVVQTNGRIAYLVVNSSGLLDANCIGGATRNMSTNINEIDITGIIPDDEDFVVKRDEDGRYETIQELFAINDYVDPYHVSNLTVMSFDRDRDVYFGDADGDGLLDTNELGSTEVQLFRKFYINKITNFFSNFEDNPEPENAQDCYWNGRMGARNEFSDQFYLPMYALLLNAGLFDAGGPYTVPPELVPPALNPAPAPTPSDPAVDRPKDVVWNIVNYLDPDRVPRSNSTYPYLHTEAVEPVPLVNEIVFLDPDRSDTNNWYQFEVELWYPFAPLTVEPTDDFILRIGVFTNDFFTPTPAGGRPPELEVMNHREAKWSADFTIDYMRYGTDTEFLVFTNYIPSAPDSEYIRFPSNAPVSDANCVYFLARVLKVDDFGSGPVTNPVNESMGYQKDESDSARRRLKKFNEAPVSYSINDPRISGQCRYWDPTMDGAGSTLGITGRKYGGSSSRPYSSTLDTTNSLTAATAWFTVNHEGLPIYAPTNHPMQSIAELGHIYRSNMDDEVVADPDAGPEHAFWRNLELMIKDEGARLLDWITVRPTNEIHTTYGLASISTRQRETIYNLLHGLQLGWSNAYASGSVPIDEAAAWDLTEELVARTDSDGPFLQFQSLFDNTATAGGPIAAAFRGCVPLPMTAMNDIQREAAFSSIVELLSFRQNTFTVFVAAQSLGRNGTTVVGAQRGVANIVRDSYTGQYFIRNFKWLND